MVRFHYYKEVFLPIHRLSDQNWSQRSSQISLATESLLERIVKRYIWNKTNQFRHLQNNVNYLIWYERNYLSLTIRFEPQQASNLLSASMNNSGADVIFWIRIDAVQ